MGALLSSFNDVDDVHARFNQLVKSAGKKTGASIIIIPQLSDNDGVYDMAIDESDQVTVACTSCGIMKAVYRNKPCGHVVLCKSCLIHRIHARESMSLGVCGSGSSSICMRKVEEIERAH